MAVVLDSNTATMATSEIIRAVHWGVVSAQGCSWNQPLYDKAKVTSINVYMYKVGSPTGTLKCRVASHTGVYGTSSKPLADLETSTNSQDIASLSSDSAKPTLVTFTFAGVAEILKDTPYTFYVYAESGSLDGSNYCDVRSTANVHDGNRFQPTATEGVWASSTSRDLRFQVYGEESPPSPPTNVQATDGTYPYRVKITWTKSAGATNYRVFRDGVNVSGTLGDVATYDDTGAGAPTITAGSTIASDGSHIPHVALSLSGTSVNNGTTHTYKVQAYNAAGWSGDSDTDTGYRGHGPLTYQWQRSAADSPASYSNISGATSSTYNDTAAPAPTITPGAADASDGTFSEHVALSLSGQSANDGAGRYYRCYLTATGCSAKYSSANRGYRGVGSLTYQWQRSAADSDADYSNISGATTASYNDTGAPADGSGRYYQCVENATGATQQTSSSDRGYRKVGPPAPVERFRQEGRDFRETKFGATWA